MRGATEYARMFRTGQHGKLFLVSGSHARGETFHIWILPSEEEIKGMPWEVKNAVEVYGITGGQPGWTETYGWLHKGMWRKLALVVLCGIELKCLPRAPILSHNQPLKKIMRKKIEGQSLLAVTPAPPLRRPT